MARARVGLFKPSGKWYTDEEWTIPAEVPAESRPGMRATIGPYDMEHSPDFRRIDGGAVLVYSQEPWGYEHLFPSPSFKEQVRELVRAAEHRIADEDWDRQAILEGLLRDLKAAVERDR